MQRYRFPLAVLGTSLVLVGVLGLLGYLAGGAFAAGPGGWHHAGGPWGDFSPPAGLSGLRDIPAADRFAHFRGVQVNLTDKDNHPVTISVTPGTITSVSPTSLTLSGNDGASHTFAVDAQTIERGPLSQGQKVVVATVDGSQTAMAVMAGDWHR